MAHFLLRKGCLLQSICLVFSRESVQYFLGKIHSEAKSLFLTTKNKNPECLWPSFITWWPNTVISPQHKKKLHSLSWDGPLTAPDDSLTSKIISSAMDRHVWFSDCWQNLCKGHTRSQQRVVRSTTNSKQKSDSLHKFFFCTNDQQQKRSGIFRSATEK